MGNSDIARVARKESEKLADYSSISRPAADLLGRHVRRRAEHDSGVFDTTERVSLELAGSSDSGSI